MGAMSKTMDMSERELLKRKISALDDSGELKHVVMMIAHWHRQRNNVSFTDYAANWAVANRYRGTETMQEVWPIVGPRHILDRMSDWQEKPIDGNNSAAPNTDWFRINHQESHYFYEGKRRSLCGKIKFNSLYQSVPYKPHPTMCMKCV